MLERDLIEAHNLHPYYNSKSLLSVYNKALSHLSKDSIRQADLSRPITLKKDERDFVNELYMSVIDSKDDENMGGVLVFLQKQTSEEINEGSQAGVEFKLFKKIFTDGVRPVLESSAFAGEYKVTKRSFADLVKTLISSFEGSSRIMFVFHAGELFKAKEYYVNGKNLGLSNALTLGLRNFIRSI